MCARSTIDFHDSAASLSVSLIDIVNDLLDLHLVHRQLLQVRERRVASAEVVDRQAYAEPRASAVDGGDRTAAVHDARLGDLHREVLRVEACDLQHAVDRPPGKVHAIDEADR